MLLNILIICLQNHIMNIRCKANCEESFNPFGLYPPPFRLLCNKKLLAININSCIIDIMNLNMFKGKRTKNTGIVGAIAAVGAIIAATRTLKTYMIEKRKKK